MSSVPVMSKNAVKRAAKAARRAEAKRLKRGNACSWEPPATDLLPTVNKRAPGCRRYKATVSYNGADFHGWAPQHPPGKAPLRTVGSVMEGGFRAAIGQRVRVHPAGRTDSGVSAIGQVCQFDAEGYGDGPADLAELCQRINAELPSDCRVLKLEHATPNFAAMGNLWKRYAYTVPGGPNDTAETPAELLRFCQRVLQQQGCRSRTIAGGSSRVEEGCVVAEGGEEVAPAPPSRDQNQNLNLDLDRMRASAAVLVGRHDFAAFQSKGGRKSTVRTLHSCEVSWADGKGLRIEVNGDGFLYNMVRILCGTLLEAGCGLRTVGETAQLVAPGGGMASAADEDSDLDAELVTAATRVLAGPTLPAEHLCLEHVEFDTPWPASD
eukprot:gene4877-31490_t